MNRKTAYAIIEAETQEIPGLPSVTTLLRNTLADILDTYFSDASDFARGELATAFAEPIHQRNTIYLREHVGIIGADFRIGPLTPDQLRLWAEAMKDIREKLQVAIRVQGGRYKMFLAAITPIQTVQSNT